MLAKHIKTIKQEELLLHTHITKVEQDRTVSLIDEASFFSLTIDGATGVSSTEQKSVYILCT